MRTREDSRIAQPIGAALDRFIKRDQDNFKGATGELSQLLRDIALAGKVVNREMNKAGLINILGAVGTQNIQGEDQQKLDILANIRFIRALTKGEEVCAIVSEEDEKVIMIDDSKRYVVAIDPLDGSSNIDVNVSVGTIFSIYRRVTPVDTPVLEEDYLQRGDKQIAAGYILYGSSTMLVYTTGAGVNGFTYDQSLGEYFLSHQNMKTPEDGKVYSMNEGASNTFDESVKKYIDYCKEQQYSGRYIGSLVADFHRNLLKGGIYIYPSTATHTTGKLRLLYECNALAFIIERAGGMATDGKKRILEIEPTSLHQRVPFFVGSKKMVEKSMSFVD